MPTLHPAALGRLRRPAAAMADALHSVTNSFHIGAYQAAINAAGELSDLSEKEATERDAFTYRAYLALGSHQARARAAARRGVRASAPSSALP